MRIALITEYYFPHLGGVTEHVHHLAERFTAQGHHVVVVTAAMDGQGPDAPFVRRIGSADPDCLKTQRE